MTVLEELLDDPLGLDENWKLRQIMDELDTADPKHWYSEFKNKARTYDNGDSKKLAYFYLLAGYAAKKVEDTDPKHKNKKKWAWRAGEAFRFFEEYCENHDSGNIYYMKIREIITTLERIYDLNFRFDNSHQVQRRKRIEIKHKRRSHWQRRAY